MPANFFYGDIEVIRVDDLWIQLRVKPEEILHFVSTGELKARKIGDRYFVSRERLREFVNVTDGLGKHR